MLREKYIARECNDSERDMIERRAKGWVTAETYGEVDGLSPHDVSDTYRKCHDAGSCFFRRIHI